MSGVVKREAPLFHIMDHVKLTEFKPDEGNRVESDQASNEDTPLST